MDSKIMFSICCLEPDGYIPKPGTHVRTLIALCGLQHEANTEETYTLSPISFETMLQKSRIVAQSL